MKCALDRHWPEYLIEALALALFMVSACAFGEILEFPPGMGDPRWQRRGALLLGIDHAAIVVDDTEESLGF